MILQLSPQRRDDLLTLKRTGDKLTINGTVFDFSQLTEGQTLPREAIDNEFICGDVTRTDGKLIIPILLPHGAEASHEARFPEPITLTTDGQVVLPI